MGSSAPDVESAIRRENAAGVKTARTVVRRDVFQRVPLSFPQERFWFLDRMTLHRPAFHCPVLLRATGQLDLRALEFAIHEIVARHEPLRSTFKSDGARPEQIVSACLRIRLEVSDLRALAPAERDVQAQFQVLAEAERPFDLESGPPLRARCIRLTDVECLIALTFHHIVFDGWSSRVLLRELLACYEAFSAGRPVSLPALPQRYTEFAVWQREQMDTNAFGSQLDYWKKRLSGLSYVLDIPADRQRPSVFSRRGARHVFEFRPELRAALKQVCRQEGATLYMLLLAALNVLLFRYTDKEQILIGSNAANRNRSEIEPLIGCFVNLLVMRSDLSGEMSFREFLKTVRDTALDAFMNQDVPFEKVVEQLQAPGDLSYTPIVQVLFEVKQRSTTQWQAPGLLLERLDLHNGGALCDLAVQVIEKPDGLSAWFDYNTDIFEAATIERMAGHFTELLAGITADPTQRLCSIPLLGETERQQVLVQWNATQATMPRQQTIHELVEAQAGRTPHAVAVEFEDQSLSYAELNARADQLAARLRGLGVGPDSVVPMCVERSIEMVVALLGILKAGGAYLPLDPAHPKERLEFVLRDCGAQIVLSHKAALASVPQSGARVIRIDEPAPTTVPEPRDPMTAQRSGPENTAYVMYTSGSTGKPKGVLIAHRSAANLLACVARETGCTEKDRLLAITTISFDIATLEMFLPLMTGARLIVAPRAACADSRLLTKLIDSSGATLLQATPVTWRMLLEAGWAGSPNLRALVGGEALSSELALQLAERTAACWNVYGPTETTIWSTAAKLKRGDKQVTIGRPLDNTQIYLLDRQRQPVPIGVPGELYIAGAGVAKGYLNRPELTAERFVVNPFDPSANSRMYATGDLARYSPDGSIDYLGRIDQQVKVRGFRIELGEIECILGQHPKVSQAVVVARTGPNGDKMLVGYVVPREQNAPDVIELQTFLKTKLPDYMIPPAFVTLTALPLTPSGKVDRKALPEPSPAKVLRATRHVAPRDKIEAELAKAWESILGVSNIGVGDNFFDLGGYSLMAVRLVSFIEKLYGKSLPLATLLQAPTVEELAAILRQNGWTASWSSLVPMRTQGSRPPFYCVHPVGGNVLCYYDLAQNLGGDQPVYGLQAPGLDGKRAFDFTIEELARHHVRELRGFQPEGPYYLGGASMGGTVAFEMAQQLIRQGQKVGLLTLFDTHGPKLVRIKDGRHLRQFMQRVSEILDNHCGNLARLTPAQAIVYLGRKIKWLKFRTIEKAAELFSGSSLFSDTLAKIEEGARAAARKYVVQPYPGRITLFRASHSWHSYLPDPHLGWDGIAAEGLEVFEVRGYHSSIFIAPRVTELAGHLRTCLQKAQSEAEDLRGPNLPASTD
ncbi:MAG TPA: amino acid adenylation domain-containing protein [Planctomycetota bacterium]|jgi:aspartate racemase